MVAAVAPGRRPAAPQSRDRSRLMVRFARNDIGASPAGNPVATGIRLRFRRRFFPPSSATAPWLRTAAVEVHGPGFHCVLSRRRTPSRVRGTLISSTGRVWPGPPTNACKTSLAHRPSAVDGLCRVRCDLKGRAVMVRIATGNVVSVIRHELHDLQRASRAINIR
jgi:hypothetical protein